MIKDEMLTRLKEFDETLYLIYSGKYAFDFTIIGGSALVLNFSSARSTPDIDVLNLNREIVEIAEKFDINSRANAYSDCFPYNYEKRLEKINYEFKCCSFNTPSLEDLVISKLVAYRAKDREDLYSKNILEKIDWDKLETIMEKDFDEEMCCIPPNLLTFLKINYKEYKKDNKK